MDKNIIKKHLNNKFLTEAKEEEQTNTPGISVTNAAKKQSEKENKQGVKDMDKELADYQKSLEKGMETTKTPNKFNYSDNEEVEYHNQMEIRNGQEMIQYDRDPIQEFKDRAKEALEGSSRMGNNPEWANVIPAQKGFTGPDFGKNLVKDAEASFQKRMAAEKGNYSFGGDIENENRAGLKMTRFSALAENNVNNKPQIKESMKRLRFKTEFKGVGNALKMIPESYKVDNKTFEMTDGVENYKIRWEGNLTEGRAVVLVASDKNLVNEDMQKMKQLMGYKSQDTLGTVKGKARLDENKMFTDIWSKTRQLMEMEEIEGQDADKEAEFDKADVKHAAEAKKHVEGSVSTEKGTKAPAPKTGNFDEVKKSAPEATKHVEGSVSSEKGTQTAKPKEGNWDEIKKSAPEATKHVHMGENVKKKGVKLGESYFEPMEETMDEISTGLAKKAADKAYSDKMRDDAKGDKLGYVKHDRQDKKFSNYINPEIADAILKIGNIVKVDDYGIIFSVGNGAVKLYVAENGYDVLEGDMENLTDTEISYLTQLIPKIKADLKSPTKSKNVGEGMYEAELGENEYPATDCIGHLMQKDGLTYDAAAQACTNQDMHGAGMRENEMGEDINEEDMYKDITQYGWKVYDFLREMFPEIGEEERMIKILESAIRITKSSIEHIRQNTRA